MCVLKDIISSQATAQKENLKTDIYFMIWVHSHCNNKNVNQNKISFMKTTYGQLVPHSASHWKKKNNNNNNDNNNNNNKKTSNNNNKKITTKN